MRLQSLKHLVGVAAAIAPSRRIIVLGSSSLLASFPELGELDGLLEASFDADLLIDGVDEMLAGVLEESIGNESLFKTKEGYYADVLRPAALELLPRDWEARLIALPGCDAAFCLEPHDLAVVKLQTGRPKDMRLCATLLATRRLQRTVIQKRLQETAMEDRMRVLAAERLKEISGGLG